jgi:transposase-like protein
MSPATTKPKKCPSCKHPMMSGPLQPKRGSGDNRVADWWCADCHYTIWAVKVGVWCPACQREHFEPDPA